MFKDKNKQKHNIIAYKFFKMKYKKYGIYFYQKSKENYLQNQMKIKIFLIQNSIVMIKIIIIKNVNKI